MVEAPAAKKEFKPSPERLARRQLVNREDMASVYAAKSPMYKIAKRAFDIVLFERYVYGESVLENYSFFHEAIILKVYEGTIIESFFLSYDWKEPPMSTPIQVSHKKLPIERVMETSDFDFKLLNEFGHNLLEDDCKIIIPDNVDFLHGSRRQINETE